jgi:hypothetical protein
MANFGRINIKSPCLGLFMKFCRFVPTPSFVTLTQSVFQVLSVNRKKQKGTPNDVPFCLVRERGLEPPRVASLVPKTSASTNSATRACFSHIQPRAFAWIIYYPFLYIYSSHKFLNIIKLFKFTPLVFRKNKTLDNYIAVKIESLELL